VTGLRRPLAAGAVAALALVAALVTAAVAAATATAAVLVVVAAAEAVADRHRLVRRLRRRVGAGPATLLAAEWLVVLLLAARTSDTARICAAAGLALGAVGAAIATEALAALVRRDREPPVLTRNVPLGVDAPPPVAGLELARTGAVLAPAVTAIGFAADRHGSGAVTAIAAAGVLTLIPVLLVTVAAARLRSAGTRAAVTEAAVAAFAATRPQVLLYFAGTPAEVYQLDMWLRPVEQLGLPAAVVVRDHEVLGRVGPTSLPVFSVRHNGTMASLAMSERTVGLFVTHSGNNLSLLRRREVRSVFVGHGDSDKPDSMNPFARVYDEVWVAGPVGKQRYLDADIGVRSDAIIAVGRPQLPATWPTPPQPTTVLYAPTWEGWGDDDHHTSLPHVGPRLVRALLDAGLRVLYRPHPLTGVRNPAVRRAHDEVLAVLRAAGAVDVPGPARPPQTQQTQTRRAEHADALAAAVATGAEPGQDRCSWEHGADAWADGVLAADDGLPVVVTGDPPTLHQTFRAAHLLVTDVSSVASDWLSTQRPYAMVDTRDLGSTEFRRRFPVAAGAVVVGADLEGLDQLWATDPQSAATARALTRDAVLGPADPQPVFRAAVLALLAPAARPAQPAR
jgi:hypothetical protein